MNGLDEKPDANGAPDTLEVLPPTLAMRLRDDWRMGWVVLTLLELFSIDHLVASVFLVLLK